MKQVSLSLRGTGVTLSSIRPFAPPYERPRLSASPLPRLTICSGAHGASTKPGGSCRSWPRCPETSSLPRRRTEASFFGLNSADNNISAYQFTWDYLAVESGHSPLYSLLRFATSEILLIRSETLSPSRVPTPFNNQACPASFMNIAYGGRVTGTDCRIAETNLDWAKSKNKSTQARFFGQVDTSAVLLLTGLGDGQSNRSADALDETIQQWLYWPPVLNRLNSLLLARGFAVGVDASLVTVTETSLIPAASWLQFTLVFLAVTLALVLWVVVTCLPTDQWSHTLLWNLEEGLMGRSRQAARGSGGG